MAFLHDFNSGKRIHNARFILDLTAPHLSTNQRQRSIQITCKYYHPKQLGISPESEQKFICLGWSTQCRMRLSWKYRIQTQRKPWLALLAIHFACQASHHWRGRIHAAYCPCPFYMISPTGSHARGIGGSVHRRWCNAQALEDVHNILTHHWPEKIDPTVQGNTSYYPWNNHQSPSRIQARWAWSWFSTWGHHWTTAISLSHCELATSKCQQLDQRRQKDPLHAQTATLQYFQWDGAQRYDVSTAPLHAQYTLWVPTVISLAIHTQAFKLNRTFV